MKSYKAFWGVLAGATAIAVAAPVQYENGQTRK